MISGQRLFLVCVYDGAEEVFVVETFEQRAFVDYSASRHVDYDGALRKPRDLPLADHPGRFVGEGSVECQDVRLLEQGIERLCLLHPQCFKA